MSNKFTGITSAGSAIPVYDKDAHEALSSKLDITAFSSVSGEFATIDDVVAAVSGKADTSATNFIPGPGISITQPSEGTVMIANDETVLWSGAGTSAVTLNEPFTNFNDIKIYHGATNDEWTGLSVGAEFRFWHMYGTNTQATFKCAMIQASAVDSTHITIMRTKTLNYNFTAESTQANAVTNNDTYAKNIIIKVIGINRKAQ